MPTLSYTEENYLKAIFKISEDHSGEAGTNELATDLSVKPASVTEMLKKLKEKKLVNYEKYGKIQLTKTGKTLAIDVVRKHRLWETFLYDKLGFNWDEVHEIAEEMEHIRSKKLIEKLDQFLDFPKYNPHGDPIPNVDGIFKKQSQKSLTEAAVGEKCKMVAVKDNSGTFLRYVADLGLGLEDEINVISRHDFDGLTTIEIKNKVVSVSQKFTDNIFVV